MINKKRISKGFWIWGQFDASSTELITQFHKKANYTLNGPSFDVHLTISGPILDLEKGQKSKLDKLTKSLSSVKLQLNGIGMKDHFFQSLFININNNLDFKNIELISEVEDDKLCFFPDGSSNGGTIKLKSKYAEYEIGVLSATAFIEKTKIEE